ncbi:Cytochrome P450 [Aspergillus sclerotialis]|uniref:Cytochrome P450 n=1 Tax=Aspergillus sclerotialis TaxID=2070753 RepID=A0A3A2ZA33_9EURO|nr:Cytochrome P450 [Aspergillus sclerotialis]
MQFNYMLELLLAGLTYFILKIIYRLYFHPLSKFPGPKLAASTHLFEFYHDVVRHGKFLWEIEKMHFEYGTHEHHRFRRGLLNKLFSKKSVHELAPMMESTLRKLAFHFEEAYKRGTVICLDDAFTALTADIISYYSYGESLDFLEADDFKGEFREAAFELLSFLHINRFFPYIIPTLQLLPHWVACKVRPKMTALFEFQNTVVQHSLRSIHETTTTNEGITKPSKRGIVFETLNHPSVPAPERTLQRLQDEGTILLVAGTEVVARALTIAMFHLNWDKSLLRKLRSELVQVMPTPSSSVNCSELEQLPYLTGVVNEAMRHTYSMMRLPRVARTEQLKYEKYIIPAGTPVSMSSHFVHMDPNLFPEPETFKPERWVIAAEKKENLTKFIVSFTRGSRACIGMHLTYVELYQAIAILARRFDIELYECSIDDMRFVRDIGLGYPEKGNLTIRARVTGIVQQ